MGRKLFRWTTSGLICLSFTTSAQEIPTTEAAGADASTGVQLSQPGPWGDLEYFPIALEPPDQYVTASGHLEAKLVWHFPNKTLTEIIDLLATTGLQESDINLFTGPGHLIRTGDQVSLQPPLDAVEGLSPEVRSKIYVILRQWEQNEFYAKPFPVFSSGFDLMVHESGMSPSAIDIFKKLSYRWGSAPSFSDLPILLSHAQNDHERWRIAKTVMRSEGLVVRLKLSAQSDLESIMTYWSSPARRKNLKVFAEPLTKTPDVNTLDIVHLLPPTPRKLLYTYASPLMGIGSTFPDCFWTAFNFFAFEPSNRYLDTTSHRTFLTDEKWERATLPPRFGDVIIVTDGETGEPMHACNFIADDIVFTKNGRSLLRPFVFMKLENVLKNYLKSRRSEVFFYRLKSEDTETVE